MYGLTFALENCDSGHSAASFTAQRLRQESGQSFIDRGMLRRRKRTSRRFVLRGYALHGHSNGTPSSRANEERPAAWSLHRRRKQQPTTDVNPSPPISQHHQPEPQAEPCNQPRNNITTSGDLHQRQPTSPTLASFAGHRSFCAAILFAVRSSRLSSTKAPNYPLTASFPTLTDQPITAAGGRVCASMTMILAIC